MAAVKLQSHVPRAAGKSSFAPILTAAFIGLLMLIVADAAISVISLRMLIERNNLAEEHARDLLAVERLRSTAERMVASNRAFLLTASPDYLEKARLARGDFDERLRDLNADATSPEEADLVRAIDLAAVQYRDAIREAVETRSEEQAARSVVLVFENRVQPLRAQLEARLLLFIDFATGESEEAQTRSDAFSHNASVILLASAGLAMFLGVWIARAASQRLRTLHRAEQQAVEAAQSAGAARQEVLAVVAHDLRNPLSSILLNAQRLRGGPADDKWQRIVESLIRSAERMDRLISDVLDAAAIQSGQLPMTLGPVELASLIESTAMLFEPIAESKQVVVRYDVKEKDLTVWADRERVLQVLSNLVGNALKFTAQGGEVSIEATRTPRGVRVSVKDTGPGISSEHLAHVFDRHWRVPGTASKGVGLGLYISRAIVEAHGGRIWVESELGKGTVFQLELARDCPCSEPITGA